jgi:5-oxoprolinase (ATP-hydrolysing)/N-methylhydantoinase A
VRFRKRDDDGLAMLVSVYPEGVDNPIPGLFGGHAGGGARGLVHTVDGRLLRDCGTGALVSLHGADQVVELVLGGGAGFGDPEEREQAAVSRDLALGFVTPEYVARYYRRSNVPASSETDPSPGTIWA